MEEKVVTMKKFKRDVFVENAKRKVKSGIDTVKSGIDTVVEYGIEHPGQAIAFVSACGVLAGKAAKIYGIRAEQYRRECDFYDTRTGIHSMSKRPLKPYEKICVTKRFKDNKESYDEILYSMNLLKK